MSHHNDDIKQKSSHHRKPRDASSSCCEAGSQLELEQSVLDFIKKEKAEKE